MKTTLLVLAACGLALSIVPPLLYFAHATDLDTLQHLMTLGMILWFAADLTRVFGPRSTP